jgi:hypothetical protein
MAFSGLKMAAIASSLSSGTETIPVLWSLVQKGYFSAGTCAAVMALKSVDLPTFGRPTIPQFMLRDFNAL